jgi:hypothetical protein
MPIDTCDGSNDPSNTKATSAVVNIASAMQYQLTAERSLRWIGPEIGLRVGAAVGGVSVVMIIMFMVKICILRNKVKIGRFDDRRH